MASTSNSRRKNAACQRCHHKKIKCFGGLPCRSCQSAGATCIYPIRDRNITISEAYLSSLEARLTVPPQMEAPTVMPAPNTQSLNLENERPQPGQVPTRVPLLDNSTTENFVSGLHKLGRVIEAPSSTVSHREGQFDQRSSYLMRDQTSLTQSYDYFHLDHDTASPKITINLPPYPYAVQLVNQFETFIGFEYHWYRRSLFRQRFETTYRNSDSPQARDRIWLCQMLGVFALGESYNIFGAPSIHISDESSGEKNGHKPVPPPGVVFFEQALSLFKMPSEEPTIDHVQALNLITFYCYSLNRRRTAYMYAGLGLRIACSLMLHKPCTEPSEAVCEHQNRIWWTTWQLDTMTASELGLNPTFRLRDAETSLPSMDRLGPDEQSDFAECQILKAHINLYSIKTEILEIARRLRIEDITDFQDVVQGPIQQLEQWRAELPAEYSFTFSQGIPQKMLMLTSMRSLASVYLRYHQLRIFLIRPVFFKLLALVVGNDTNNAFLDSWISLSNMCLDAAKANMRILTGLWKCDRIAKYGFWESVHLFSSVKIFSLARIIDTIRPNYTFQDHQDLALYTESRELLAHMAAIGNLAAKGHLRLLEDTEKLLDILNQSQLHDQADFDPEIFNWINTLNSPDYFLDNTAVLRA